MEETKSTNHPRRPYCENDSCKKPRKLYCSNHNQVLCNSCFTALHIRCNCTEIPDKNDIQECFDVVKALIDSTQQHSEDLNASHHIKELDNDLKFYHSMLAQAEGKVINSFKDDKFNDFKAIKADIWQVQKSFVESNCFSELCKFKELKSIAARGSNNTLSQNDCNQYFESLKFKIFKEKILKEVQEQNDQELDRKAKKIKEKTINDSKEHMKQLERTIQEQTKQNKILTDKNLILTKEIKKQTEEFEKQKQKIIDSIAEEEKKQIEKEQQELKEKEKLEADKLKDSETLFNKIYERNIGSKISDIAKFDLQINLTDLKQKAVFEEIVTSKLKLPKIKRIKIDNISDDDKDLLNFFEYCIPFQLDLLCINYTKINTTGIKANYYINSLCKAITTVTKEIVLDCFEFTEQELEQVLKASFNCERVLIIFSDIHCSKSLDFKISQKYKTKYLSFQACGRTDCTDRKADWKTDASKFENIVDAVSKCGLKDSLEKFDIWANQTLSKGKVQLLFNSKGMTHISVVDNGANPSSP